MENHNPSEPIFFDEADGKIYTSRPNDKAIAISMNQPGSGGFFVYHHEEEIKTQCGDSAECCHFFGNARL